MKVVILGAKGMLGQELVKIYADQEVLPWDRDECDVLDAETCEQKIRDAAPDLIINAIGYNAVDNAEDEGKDIAQALNTDAPGRLAALAADLGIPFVHYGTEYVFDGTKHDGYTEDDTPNPLSVYGSSKRGGEEAVLNTHSGAYVIRLSRLFGKPATSEAGKKSFVDVMLYLSESKDTLDVVDEEESAPTYAPDLAARTRWILENKEPGLYHVTNSGSCTWYTFAQEIFKQAGKTMTLNAVTGDAFPRPAKRPMHAVLRSEKLDPMRSWQEALADYLQNR